MIGVNCKHTLQRKNSLAGSPGGERGACVEKIEVGITGAWRVKFFSQCPGFGAALLVIWIFIVVSHLRLRKQLEASGKLTVRMWLFPYLSYATLAMLGVFVVLMLFDADARAQLISTTVLFLVIAALGFLNARWRKQNQPV